MQRLGRAAVHRTTPPLQVPRRAPDGGGQLGHLPGVCRQFLHQLYGTYGGIAAAPLGLARLAPFQRRGQQTERRQTGRFAVGPRQRGARPGQVRRGQWRADQWSPQALRQRAIGDKMQAQVFAVAGEDLLMGQAAGMQRARADGEGPGRMAAVRDAAGAAQMDDQLAAVVPVPATGAGAACVAPREHAIEGVGKPGCHVRIVEYRSDRGKRQTRSAWHPPHMDSYRHRLRHLAIVGCGGMAQDCYLPALRHLLGEEAASLRLSLVDPIAERADTLAARWPGPATAHRDADAFLESALPDAAFIVATAGACASVAIPFIAATVPCLIEKPPARNTRELAALSTRSRAIGALVEVAFNRRAQRAARHARSEAEHLIGALRAVRGRLLRRARPDPDFALTGLHLVDIAAWCAGDRYRHADLHYPTTGGDHIAYALYGRLRSGVPVELTIDPMAGTVSEDLELHGERGTLHLSLAGRDRGVVTAACLERVDDDGRHAIITESERNWWAANGVAAMVHDFLRRVVDGARNTPHHPGTATTTIALMTAMQARAKRWDDTELDT